MTRKIYLGKDNQPVTTAAATLSKNNGRNKITNILGKTKEFCYVIYFVIIMKKRKRNLCV